MNITVLQEQEREENKLKIVNSIIIKEINEDTTQNENIYATTNTTLRKQ